MEVEATTICKQDMHWGSPVKQALYGVNGNNREVGLTEYLQIQLRRMGNEERAVGGSRSRKINIRSEFFVFSFRHLGCNREKTFQISVLPPLCLSLADTQTHR